MSEEQPTETLKDEGNREFKAGNWLKAAALYTKAIKADPGNSVLYRLVTGNLAGLPARQAVSSGAFNIQKGSTDSSAIIWDFTATGALRCSS